MIIQKKFFHKLREREYNSELMRLYVVGGGGCMIQNFGDYDKDRVTIVRDICATAKGYEAMTVRKNSEKMEGCWYEKKKGKLSNNQYTPESL